MSNLKTFFYVNYNDRTQKTALLCVLSSCTYTDKRKYLENLRKEEK